MSKDLQTLVLPALQSLAERIKQKHEQLGYASNTLDEVEVVVTDNAYEIRASDALQDLSEALKRGIRPQNLNEIIARYVEQKGISVRPIPAKEGVKSKISPEERGLKRIADLIVNKVQKDGTTLDRLLADTSLFENDLDEALTKIEQNLLDNYEEQLFKINNEVFN